MQPLYTTQSSQCPCSSSLIQDPGIQSSAESSPSPVNVDTRVVRQKRKSKAKGKKNGSKKQKKAVVEASVEAVAGSTDQELVNSFKEEYRSLIESMPPQLRPTSSRHGEHSYTVSLSSKVLC